MNINLEDWVDKKVKVTLQESIMNLVVLRFLH